MSERINRSPIKPTKSRRARLHLASPSPAPARPSRIIQPPHQQNPRPQGYANRATGDPPNGEDGPLPIRIIKEPTKVKPIKGMHGTNTTHPILLITCNNGFSYTINELASLLGRSRQQVAWRLREVGWQDPRCLDFSEDNDCRCNRRGGNTSGNSAWAALSNRPRLLDLDRIPPAGSWESSGGRSKNINVEGV